MSAIKWHKCMMCDSLYMSNEPGYYGYCSDDCRFAADGHKNSTKSTTTKEGAKHE